MTSPTPTDRHIISIDAESNGLGGYPFAVALTLNELVTGTEIEQVVFRAPIIGPVDPWVAENVLPAIADLPETAVDYSTMLGQALEVWKRWMIAHELTGSPPPITLVHVLWPVESRLLHDMFPNEQVWGGPFPVIDVAGTLDAHGYDPKTVDGYMETHQMTPPPGSPHNPLYDCRSAFMVYQHLIATAVAVGGGAWGRP